MDYDIKSGKVNPEKADSTPATKRDFLPAAEEARLLTENVLANSSKHIPQDPTVIAAAFVVEQARDHNGVIPVRYHRGRWFVWTGGRYKEVHNHEIETLVRTAADNWFLRVAKRFSGKKTPVSKEVVSNTLAALLSVRGVSIPPEVAAPCWLTGDGPVPAGDVIVFTNGVLDVAAGSFRKAAPDLFNHQAFNFDYDPKATCPMWEKVVLEILGSPALVDLWQEFCGYCLTPDTKYEKAVLFYGTGGNGKSTLRAPLEAVMGNANRSSLGLDQFGDRFSLPLTQGKLVNICADQGGVTIAGKAEGNLRRFISGEPIAIERKGIDVYDYIPTAKLVLCANNWPKFVDKSDAFPMRFIVIELTRTFRDADGDDKGLKTAEYWANERAGFVNWALVGLRRLRRRGRFEIPAEAEPAARKCWASKSASYFLKRFVRSADGARSPIDDLYQKYEAQTRDAGYPSCDKTTFGKAVRALFPQIENGRMLVAEGRDTAYIGIEYVPGGV